MLTLELLCCSNICCDSGRKIVSKQDQEWLLVMFVGFYVSVYGNSVDYSCAPYVCCRHCGHGLFAGVVVQVLVLLLPQPLIYLLY